MTDTEGETTKRSKQASGTRSMGAEVGPGQIEQVAELIKTIDQSWLETLGDWLGVIGQVLEGALKDE